jgi:hypothetical protein
MTPGELRAAADLLTRQGMPRRDVDSVLRAHDPRVIRRHLELHRERLMERSIDESRAVERLERVLMAEDVDGPFDATRRRSRWPCQQLTKVGT